MKFYGIKISWESVYRIVLNPTESGTQCFPRFILTKVRPCTQTPQTWVKLFFISRFFTPSPKLRASSMPTHKGFTATIYDAQTSQPLEEYAPTINTSTGIVTTYIETTADQAFTIVLRDSVGGISQGTAVFVDGVYVDNGLTGPGIASERRWFGKRVDHINVLPFVFRNTRQLGILTFFSVFLLSTEEGNADVRF